MLQRGPLILSLAIAVLLAGCRPSPPSITCTDTIACVEIAPGDPIKIGVMQTLYQPLAQEA